MTKVGGTAKRSKVKSPTKTTAQRIDVSASWTGTDSGIEVWCHKAFFLNFKLLLNTPQRCNTFVTWHWMTLHYNTLQRRYITLHYTMNFKTKVTIPKKKRSEYTRYLGTESKGRAHCLLNLAKFVHFICFNKLDFSRFHT